MGFDPFKEHYLKSHIFEKKVIRELLAHFPHSRKISENELFLPEENELIIVDYFLTIRRKFTKNYYIDRKNDISKNFPDLNIDKVAIIYDFEHKRFNFNFHSDPKVNYKTFQVDNYYNNNSVQRMKRYEYLQLVINERLSIKYENYFNMYDLRKFTEEIKYDIKENKKISFFIGAGISFDSGIPGWDELINSLYEIILSKIRPIHSCDIEKFRNKYGDLLKQAKILEMYLEDDFTEIIHNIIYSNYKESDNAKCLANFIATHYHKVNAFITYNYDSNIEEELGKLKISHEIVTSERYNMGCFNIYHVHGFLPRISSFGSKSEITLSEFDFIKLFEKNNWQNKIQRNALKSDICFIIGHSLTDQNLKRLLLKRRKNDKIYFFTRYERYNDNKEFDTLNRMILEDYYACFNIRIIWLEKWDHIREIVNHLCNELGSSPGNIDNSV